MLAGVAMLMTPRRKSHRTQASTPLSLTPYALSDCVIILINYSEKSE